MSKADRTADYSPFLDVSDWEPGDRLLSFKGEYAELLNVTHPNTPHKSAKVWVRWESEDSGEYYAEVFTNRSLLVRIANPDGQPLV